MIESELISLLESLGTYKIIKGEIEWQQKHWGNPTAPRQPLELWAYYLSKHEALLSQAMKDRRVEDAKEEIRILAAIALGCLMSNPPKPRDAETDSSRT